MMCNKVKKSSLLTVTTSDIRQNKSFCLIGGKLGNNCSGALSLSACTGVKHVLHHELVCGVVVLIVK